MAKQRALKAVKSGCGNCPPRPVSLDMKADIHPGFGVVQFIRDSEVEESDYWGGILVEHYENRADAVDPENEMDWRLRVDGPMSGVVYQRHAPGEWHAIEQLPGFA